MVEMELQMIEALNLLISQESALTLTCIFVFVFFKYKWWRPVFSLVRATKHELGAYVMNSGQLTEFIDKAIRSDSHELYGKLNDEVLNGTIADERNARVFYEHVLKIARIETTCYFKKFHVSKDVDLYQFLEPEFTALYDTWGMAFEGLYDNNGMRNFWNKVVNGRDQFKIVTDEKIKKLEKGK